MKANCLEFIACKAEHPIMQCENKAGLQRFGNFAGTEPAKNYKCAKVHKSWYLGVAVSAEFKNDILLR